MNEIDKNIDENLKRVANARDYKLFIGNLVNLKGRKCDKFDGTDVANWMKKRI